MTDTAPVSGHTEGPWTVAETSDTVIDSHGHEICRVPAGPRTDDYLKLIASLPALQSEVSRLSAENEALNALCDERFNENEKLRATVETLRGALTNILAACADIESSYADTVERVGRIADYEINHRTAALKAAEVRE